MDDRDLTFKEAWGSLTIEDAVEIIKLYDNELATRRGILAELRGLGIPAVDEVIDRVLGPHGA